MGDRLRDAIAEIRSIGGDEIGQLRSEIETLRRRVDELERELAGTQHGAALRRRRVMGRRVLITGVSGYWGAELARRLERSGEFEYIAGLDVRPPPADLERTEFIRADIRNPLVVDADTPNRRRHRGALGRPAGAGARQGGQAASRHQRDGVPSAPGGLREGGHGAHHHRAGLGCDLRRRAERARVLHRGHGAPISAPDDLSARRRGTRELLLEACSALPGGHGDDAALSAVARRRGSTPRSRDT